MTASSSTKVYLVRHGGTTSSAANLFAGSSNPPLSVEGRLQVSKLGLRLSRVDLAAAYCSDKGRAIETATIICTHHPKMHLVQETALREIDHGHWEGKEHTFVETQFADEYARWSADPYHFAPAGGETGESVIARALPIIQKIAHDHAGQSVLVVSHTGTNRLLLCAMLGIDPARYRDRFAQDLACLNILDFKEQDAKLILMNDTSHYTGSVT
jgi:broad specificity phosphatase PhoE